MSPSHQRRGKRHGWVLSLALWTVAGTVAALALAGTVLPVSSAAGSPALPLAHGAPHLAPAVHVQSSNTTVNVTFKEHRLLNGTTWSVTAANATKSNTTAGTQGTIVFQVPNGTLNYSIGAPAGYGVAKIEGPGSPSQTSATINGSTTLTVFFAPIVAIVFNESGLPANTTWGISIHSALPHGGPAAPANQTTSGTSITFNVVKGTWKFVVTPVPAGYRAMPPQGAIGTGHTGAKEIRFHQLHGTARFTETGLAAHTLWQVNITGPVTLNLSSKSPTIRFHLPAGTYTYTVWNFTGMHPTPETGSFTVTGPGPGVSVSITYA